MSSKGSEEEESRLTADQQILVRAVRSREDDTLDPIEGLIAREGAFAERVELGNGDQSLACLWWQRS